jgi:hypothetical protein
MNKDEADRCVDIGREAFAQGNYEKVRSFIIEKIAKLNNDFLFVGS